MHSFRQVGRKWGDFTRSVCILSGLCRKVPGPESKGMIFFEGTTGKPDSVVPLFGDKARCFAWHR